MQVLCKCVRACVCVCLTGVVTHTVFEMQLRFLKLLVVSKSMSISGIRCKCFSKNWERGVTLNLRTREAIFLKKKHPLCVSLMRKK